MTDQEWQRLFEETATAPTQGTAFAARMAQWWNDRSGTLGYVDCPVCKNKGCVFQVYDGDDALNRGAVYPVECGCMPRRRSLERIAKSGIGESLARMSMESYKVTDGWQAHVKNVAKEYLARGGSSWFLICGQVGSGKTHICTAIVGELIKRGKNVIYLPYREKIPELKRLALDSERYGRIMARWQTCEVLYIDDLFKGKTTDADVSILFELLDYRYRNRLQTIVSTERTLGELDEVDEAIASRIKHLCGRYQLEIERNSGRNLRTQGNADG